MKVKLNSKFAKPGVDINDGDLITFTDEGREDSDGKFGPKQVITVEIEGGEQKILSLNNTSKRNMLEEYGPDTAAWVGKQARVNVVKQMVGSNMRNVVILSGPNKDAEGKVIIQ